MARDLDTFPFYDALLKADNKISDVWRDNLSTFFQTMIGYLSEHGIFVPRITTTQRDKIQAPVNGQLIYNITVDKFQGFEAGFWVNLV